jgi:hypothetical protein
LLFDVPERPERWQHWRKSVVFGGVHVAASVTHPHVITGVSQQIRCVKQIFMSFFLSTHENIFDFGIDGAKYNLYFFLSLLHIKGIY